MTGHSAGRTPKPVSRSGPALVRPLGRFPLLRARSALLPARPGRGPHATLSAIAKYGRFGSLDPRGRDRRLCPSDSPDVCLSEVAVGDAGPAQGTPPAATTEVSPKMRSALQQR